MYHRDIVVRAIGSLLACLWAAVTSFAQAEFELPSPILWVPLHGDAPLASIVPDGTNEINLEVQGGDPRFVDDEHFGRVFGCGAETSFLDLPGFEGMVDSPSSFATSFWFNADERNGTETLAVIPTGNSTHIWVWLDSDGDLCVGLTCTEDMGLKDGNWHHVTISTTNVTEPSGLDVYVGGVRVSQGLAEVSAVDNDASSNALRVCASDKGDDVLNGHVVDLVVFDRGLTADEVVLNYNLRDNPFTGSSQNARSSTLVTASKPVCSDVPIPGVITFTTCEPGYACLKVHARHLSEIDPSLKLNDFSGRVGLCVPESITDKLPDQAIVPPALAFFPLTLNRLWSYPQAVYRGEGRDVSLVQDDVFGQTLYCGGNDSFVALDTVPYGIDGGGRFSINLWFKPDAGSEGDGTGEHSWLFSHGDYGAGQDTMAANQVQIYLTNGNASDYAHVTAVMHDSNDARSIGGLDQLSVDPVPVLHGDENRQVGEFVRLEGLKDDSVTDVRDGEWHMVTVTTNPSSMGSKGYVLYLDGREINRQDANSTAENVLGNVFDVHGGDMLMAMNEMFLCGRGVPSTTDEQFTFRGQLAYLSLWSTTLGPGQISMLYDTVNPRNAEKAPLYEGDGTIVLDPDTVVRTERFTIDGRACQFPAIYAGALSNDCVIYVDGTKRCQIAEKDGGGWHECMDEYADAVVETDNAADPRTAARERKEAGYQMDPCLLGELEQDVKRESSVGCKDGLVCVPSEGQDAGDDLGTCIKAPSTISRFDVFNYLYRMKMALPMSLYPLIDESLDEMTMPANTATATAIAWQWSSSFRGTVPECSTEKNSSILLETATTQNPEHTECVWFSASTNGVSNGGALSDASTASSVAASPPEQIIMGHDMMEIILRPIQATIDHNGPYGRDQYEVFLRGKEDVVSTPYLADLASRTITTHTRTASDNPAVSKDNNEQWHMACVSAWSNGLEDELADKTPDNARASTIHLYLDATLLQTITVPFNDLHDGIGMTSNVTLCPSFNGRATNYISFARALDDDGISNLYAMYDAVGVADFDGENETTGTGLSAGAITGIVIGSLICGGILAMVGFFLTCERDRRTRGSFKRHKDSNVVLPDDVCISKNGDVEPSLRQQFSAYYSGSDISEGIHRQFSYEYPTHPSSVAVHSTAEDVMNTSNPVFELSEGTSTPDDEAGTDASAKFASDGITTTITTTPPSRSPTLDEGT